MAGKMQTGAAIWELVGALPPSPQQGQVVDWWPCWIGVSGLDNLQCPATKVDLEIEQTKLEGADSWRSLRPLPKHPRSQGAEKVEIWPGACVWA